MIVGDYTPEKLIETLRGFGFRLFVGDDGVVHGKISRGTKITLEMRAVIDRLVGMNEAVAEILKNEPVRHEYVGIPVEQALEIGQRIKAGELELDGKLIYHKGTGLCDLAVFERRPQNEN